MERPSSWELPSVLGKSGRWVILPMGKPIYVKIIIMISVRDVIIYQVNAKNKRSPGNKVWDVLY